MTFTDIDFVEDTDLPMEWASKVDVQENIQYAALTWLEVIIATRGALRPVKWLFKMVNFKWTGGKWGYRENLSLTAVYVPKDK